MFTCVYTGVVNVFLPPDCSAKIKFVKDLYLVGLRGSTCKDLAF